MNPAGRERIRRAMAEASALAPGHPERRDVEEIVRANGEWARREWLDLLAENERLRLELGRVEPPPGLEDRLMRLAVDTGDASRTPRHGWILAAGALAAAVVIAVVVGLLLDRRSDPYRDQTDTLALLALGMHLNEHHFEVETDEPRAFEGQLDPKAAFAVKLPAALGRELRLRGGCTCALATHPVVYSQWHDSAGTTSLVQFRAVDFALPADLDCVLLKPGGPAAGGRSLHVLVWTRSSRGYVAVSEHVKILERIAAGLRRDASRELS